MRLLIELSGRQLTNIQRFIESGEYESLQQFVQTAIENQTYLHSVPIGELQAAERPSSLSHSRTASLDVSEKQDSLLLRPHEDPPLIKESPSPVDYPLWALYNRLFPSKIALRVLANLAIRTGEPYVDLVQLQVEAATRAWKIREWLEDLDEKNSRQRGQKLATALPRGKREKAFDRYKTMFVGSITTQGVAEGLIVDLGFGMIKLDARGRPAMALTQAGAAFTKLTNPVLDAQETEPSSTLSVEESEFCLKQIKEHLPLEWRLYRDTLSAISGGKSTPQELELAIGVGEGGATEKITEAERASMVGRLVEFGLVKRTKKGLTVSYALTHLGETFLKGEADRVD